MPVQWFFDFISPFAYLQWQRLRSRPDLPDLACQPVLLAGLLQHHGQKGPAEIPAKREFTYRHVQWKADRAGVPLRFPPAHPFNPLPALRLCVHAGATPAAIDALFDHLWRDGQRGDDAASLQPVAHRLGIDDAAAAIADPAAKARLQANFDEAIARQVFGVPTLAAHGRLFWGEDAMDMFDEAMAEPARFDTPEFERLRHLPVGIARRGV